MHAKYRLVVLIPALLLAVALGLLSSYLGVWVVVALIACSVLFLFLHQPKWLVYAILASVTLGQIGRIPPGSKGGDILLTDLLVGLLFLIWIVWIIARRQSLLLSKAHLVWVGFMLIATVGLLLNPLGVGGTQLMEDAFYLLRLAAYTSLVWIVPQLFTMEDAETLMNWVIGSGLGVVVLGFIQLYVFPDIGILSKYGWDPHVGRFVSSFLDPNFLGGYLALLVALLLGRSVQQKRPFPWFWVPVTLVAAVFTFSRSGYIAILTVVLLYGVLYFRKLLVIVVVCVIPVVMTIPRVQERVQGGFKVDLTAQDRIQSWQKALAITDKYPVLGVGYNDYRQAQQDMGTLPLNDVSRSGAGSDSSLLNVEATTGILGTGIFLVALFLLLRDCWKIVRKKEYTVQGTAALTLLLATPALFLHSFFVNAFFYPFLLAPLSILAGMVYLKNSDSDSAQ